MTNKIDCLRDILMYIKLNYEYGVEIETSYILDSLPQYDKDTFSECIDYLSSKHYIKVSDEYFDDLPSHIDSLTKKGINYLNRIL